MGEIVIFEGDGGSAAVDVLLDGDTVWLTAAQMSALFETDNTSIRKHLQNIYEDGELDQGATRANFARVQTEGDRKVTRNVPHFNLDAIISVGYRVNSKRGVKFRQWATKTLNDHLVHGYTLNQRRLAERGVLEAQQAMDLLARTLSRQESLTDESRQVLDLVTSYAKTWKTLLQYDENALSIPEGTLQNGRTTYGLGRVDAQRVGGRSFRRPRHTERVVHGDVRARAAACERSG